MDVGGGGGGGKKRVEHYLKAVSGSALTPLNEPPWPLGLRDG